MSEQPEEYIIAEDHVKMLEKRGFAWMARLIRSREYCAPERLCGSCDIIAVEERLIEVERDLEIAREQLKQDRGWDRCVECRRRKARLARCLVCRRCR